MESELFESEFYQGSKNRYSHKRDHPVPSISSGPTSSSSSNQNQSMGQPAGPSQAGEFASFYLSAVPTQEEKNEGIKGKWTRKGFYAFRFEIKTPGKVALVSLEK